MFGKPLETIRFDRRKAIREKKMNERLRPWFYAACSIVWIVVGFAPSAYQMNAEQGRLDDAFYATIKALSPEELVAEGVVVSTNMLDAKTWQEYGLALRGIEEYKIRVNKISRETNRWKADSKTLDPLFIAEVRLSTIQAVVQMKRSELVESIGTETIPEDGFKIVDTRKIAPWAILWPAVWTSWIFASLVLLVRLEACGFKIWLEMLTFWRFILFALAVMVWPIGLFKYPTGDPSRQVIRGLRFAAFALTAGLSMAPAMAFAQAKKDDGGGKRRSSPYTLSFDVRNTEVVGPEPNPEVLFKGTLTSPTGWVAQTTDVHRHNGFWATTNLFGHIFFRNQSGVRVDGLVGFSKNSTGATVILAGASGSVNRKRWMTAFPFAGYERRLDKPVKDVYLVNQTLVKMGAWRAGIETYYKKIFGAPTQYYAGGVIGRTIGKKAYAECSVNRDQLDVWRIRGRMTYALSW